MKKTALLLLLALGVLPAFAAPGGRCAFPESGDGIRSGVAAVSPTNPNDPLFPPGQWPRCMG
ncbi:MAG: hypothetical protein R3E35_06160 [Rhodocyclaceae bacterium]